jgi:hypothetical protein
VGALNAYENVMDELRDSAKVVLWTAAISFAYMFKICETPWEIIVVVETPLLLGLFSLHGKTG